MRRANRYELHRIKTFRNTSLSAEFPQMGLCCVCCGCACCVAPQETQERHKHQVGRHLSTVDRWAAGCSTLCVQRCASRPARVWDQLVPVACMGYPRLHGVSASAVVHRVSSWRHIMRSHFGASTFARKTFHRGGIGKNGTFKGVERAATMPPGWAALALAAWCDRPCMFYRVGPKETL